jgi:DNA-binding MarR family transcriptional regulator
VPSTQDERGVNVTLAPKGSSVLERVLPGHVEVVRDVLVDALDGADRDELTRLLGRVVQHMRSRPPRSARRSTAGGAES